MSLAWAGMQMLPMLALAFGLDQAGPGTASMAVQMSHPWEIKLLIQTTQQQEFTP